MIKRTRVPKNYIESKNKNGYMNLVDNMEWNRLRVSQKRERSFTTSSCEANGSGYSFIFAGDVAVVSIVAWDGVDSFPEDIVWERREYCFFL